MSRQHKLKNIKLLLIFLSIVLIAGTVITISLKSEKRRSTGENVPPINIPNLPIRIAYVDDEVGGITILNLASGHKDVIRRTESAHTPHWSPNGTHVAYSISNKDGSSFVVVRNLSKKTEKVIYQSKKYCVVLEWLHMNEVLIVDFDSRCCRTKIIHLNDGKIIDITPVYAYEKIKALIDEKKLDGSNRLSVSEFEVQSLVIIPSIDKKQKILYFYDFEGYPSIIYDSRIAQYSVVPMLSSANNPPVWSPDGRQVAFASVKDGTIDVYQVNSTSASMLVSHKYLRYINPNWSSDGKYLVFASATKGGDIPFEKGIFFVELGNNKLFRVTERGREPALF